ncbi:hypothetical protein M5K25_025403 [Dendrobium thyrsiflorum]|uniref:40S ribosomal protein S15 n=1 Tax=Dendrobium thyrsiflorum TaxID=117978 RepID=A0ABD0U3Y7_DENTH
MQGISQADVEADVASGQPKKRTFRKFSHRGVDLDALLDMSTDELVKLFSARARRRRTNPSAELSSISEFLSLRFQRVLKRKPMALIKKLRKAVRLWSLQPPSPTDYGLSNHRRLPAMVPRTSVTRQLWSLQPQSHSGYGPSDIHHSSATVPATTIARLLRSLPPPSPADYSPSNHHRPSATVSLISIAQNEPCQPNEYANVLLRMTLLSLDSSNPSYVMHSI